MDHLKPSGSGQMGQMICWSTFVMATFVQDLVEEPFIKSTFVMVAFGKDLVGEPFIKTTFVMAVYGAFREQIMRQRILVGLM